MASGFSRKPPGSTKVLAFPACAPLHFSRHSFGQSFSLLPAVFAIDAGSGRQTKRIVLIAGRPSHPPGMHEFRAGSLLLQKALSGVPGIKVDVYDMGWPAKMVDGARVDDSSLLDSADAVLIYADGGKGNPGDSGRPDEGDRRAGGKGRRASASATTAWRCPPGCLARPSSAGWAATTRRTGR